MNRWLIGEMATALAIVLVATGVAAAPDGGVAVGAGTASILLAASALPAPGSLLRLLAGLGAALAIVAFVALRRWEPA